MTADEAAAGGNTTGARRLWSRLAAQEARGYEDDIDLEDRFYAVGTYGYVVGLLIHAALIPLFYILDRDFLAGFNVFSVLVFVGCIWLNRRHEMIAAFILCTVEVCVHAILATLILGVETGFFLFLLLQSAIAILGPMRELRMRIFSCASFAALAVALVAYALVEGPSRPLANEWAAMFMVANTLSVILALAMMLYAYDRAVKAAESALQLEHGRSEALLDNILPPEVSTRLKQGEEPIADSYAEVTVLFADIVGFTERSARMPPEQLIKLLNTAFTRFDHLVDRHGLEKIKTIGDAYMVVGGLPNPREDHARAVADLALEMVHACEAISKETGEPLNVRIGINSGPVVAGVIGESKFAYDLWGDVVNTASRMESHGEPGRIQVTRETRDLLSAEYIFEAREEIDIKGKGPMTAYFLTGRATDGPTM